MDTNNKGKFNSNFGFLMACLGSAVGIGNLWGFPYKCGVGGGFAFLLVYLILNITVGYPIMLSEISLGRKTQRAAIEAHAAIDPKFKFNGVLATIVPFFLLSFYCTFGGYITHYLIASIQGLSGNAAINTVNPEDYFFQNLLSNGGSACIYLAIFLGLTILIVLGGVSGGIERFCKYAMPALFVMLLVIVVKSISMPGSAAGLSFLFKPDFSVMNTPKGLFETFKLAGSQMFFSLSISSGCIIAYGSYLSKKENLEKNSIFIVLGDTTVAILAGLAIMPACASTGLEFGAGPSLLFVSMTSVFQSMGVAGRFFQLIFWILVFFAALTSSIGMMEGGISAIMDSRIKKNKPVNRVAVTLLMGGIGLVGNLLTTLDCLGNAATVSWLHILGQSCVADVWDAVGEGILMPLTGLILAIIIGWLRPNYIDDEVESSSGFTSKKFFKFCIKWIGPIFMLMIIYGQLTTFFIK